MSEWWTYRPPDFLMFAPRTYYRLFELYNADVWPGHLLAVAGGLAVFALLWRPAPWRGRFVVAIVTASWIWVAWEYFATRYATINWAATSFAAGCAIEAALLAVAGVVRVRLAFPTDAIRARWPGLALFLFAFLIQPWIGLLFGRPWTQAELFGLAPDSTAAGTLGVLLSAERVRWDLFVIPLMWCAMSGFTLWIMGSPDAIVPPLVAVLALTAGTMKAIRRHP